LSGVNAEKEKAGFWNLLFRMQGESILIKRVIEIIRTVQKGAIGDNKERLSYKTSHGRCCVGSPVRILQIKTRN